MQARLLGEEEIVDMPDGPDNPGYRPTTRSGYGLDEAISAFTKEVRRADEDRALYWALELVDSGYAQYWWRRLSVLVAEEIGLADTNALVVVNNAYDLYERRLKNRNKWSDGPITLELIGLVVLYVCRAPKNGEAAYAVYATNDERKAGRREPVPDYALDMHTSAGKAKIREAGMTASQQEVWFWSELVRKANTVRGNRWIRRLFMALAGLSQEERDFLLREGYKEYSESASNQL